jgi:hypothetical protein
MTDISNEAVERLADHLSLEQDQEAADMLRALRSALDIAEAEKRAAVAAKAFAEERGDVLQGLVDSIAEHLCSDSPENGQEAIRSPATARGIRRCGRG